MDLIKSKVMYESKWLLLKEDHLHTKNGNIIYNIIERADTCIIVPLTKSYKTVLLKHFRYPINDFSYELPMGGIDNGEIATTAAERELREETNLTPFKLESIGSFFPNPGLSKQKASVFIAWIEDDFEELILPKDEEISRFMVSDFHATFAQIGKEIQDSFTITSLFFVEQFLKRKD